MNELIKSEAELCDYSFSPDDLVKFRNSDESDKVALGLRIGFSHGFNRCLELAKMDNEGLFNEWLVSLKVNHVCPNLDCRCIETKPSQMYAFLAAAKLKNVEIMELKSRLNQLNNVELLLAEEQQKSQRLEKLCVNKQADIEHLVNHGLDTANKKIAALEEKLKDKDVELMELKKFNEIENDEMLRTHMNRFGYNKLKQLEEKLRVAVEALEFYGNSTTTMQTHDGLYLRNGMDGMFKPLRDVATEALEKIKAK